MEAKKTRRKGTVAGGDMIGESATAPECNVMANVSRSMGASSSSSASTGASGSSSSGEVRSEVVLKESQGAKKSKPEEAQSNNAGVGIKEL